MSISETLSAVEKSEISVGDAASIVIISGPVGAIFGGSFTVHIVSSETTAVWVTTVAFSILGLTAWSLRY